MGRTKREFRVTRAQLFQPLRLAEIPIVWVSKAELVKSGHIECDGLRGVFVQEFQLEVYYTKILWVNRRN